MSRYGGGTAAGRRVVDGSLEDVGKGFVRASRAPRLARVAARPALAGSGVRSGQLVARGGVGKAAGRSLEEALSGYRATKAPAISEAREAERSRRASLLRPRTKAAPAKPYRRELDDMTGVGKAMRPDQAARMERLARSGRPEARRAHELLSADARGPAAQRRMRAGRSQWALQDMADRDRVPPAMRRRGYDGGQMAEAVDRAGLRRLSPSEALRAGVLGTGVPQRRFGKARYFDPEHRRQRRLGAAEAGLLIGGGVLVQRGVRGVRATTRAARGAAKVTDSWKNGTSEALRSGVVASRRDLIHLSNGTASIAAAGAVHRHANSRRGAARY